MSQPLTKFWLPHEDDLEQLSWSRSQLEKQEEVFEIVRGETLSIINDQQNVFAMLVFFL